MELHVNDKQIGQSVSKSYIALKVILNSLRIALKVVDA